MSILTVFMFAIVFAMLPLQEPSSGEKPQQEQESTDLLRATISETSVNATAIDLQTQVLFLQPKLVYGNSSEKHAQLGVHVCRPDDTLRRHLKIKPGLGLIVEAVVPNSGAATVGLMVDDILLKIDDQWLVNIEQFTTLIRNCEVGQTVKVMLIREGLTQELMVTLTEVAQSQSHVDIEIMNLVRNVAAAPADTFHQQLSPSQLTNCASCHGATPTEVLGLDFNLMLKREPQADPIEKAKVNRQD